jgi:hypothetical protein
VINPVVGEHFFLLKGFAGPSEVIQCPATKGLPNPAKETLLGRWNLKFYLLLFENPKNLPLIAKKIIRNRKSATIAWS